ncbi:MAG: hypothetical protein U9N59_03365 [Campylobacterota bacterium]|nr:hypothetical protein [Campylobacterota bacterium]
MVYLGYDFIITSLLWLFGIAIFVFAFRKHILKIIYPQTTFDLFLSKLKIYLDKTYPLIKFDLSIIEQSKNEKNPDSRKYTIIDDILRQFKNLNIDRSKLPQSTPQSLQWSEYIFNCEPNRDKLPPDWIKRKNALIIRDHKKCFRCSKTVTLNNIKIHMIRSLKNGGKYHLENLIAICHDCEIILNNDTKKMHQLTIKDDLNLIVQESF